MCAVASPLGSLVRRATGLDKALVLKKSSSVTKNMIRRS